MQAEWKEQLKKQRHFYNKTIKFITKNGFIGELSFGLDWFFNRNNDGIEAYPQMGIPICKRF